MKASKSQTFLILIICFTACADKKSAEYTNDNTLHDTTIISNAVPADTFEEGKVIAHVTCKSDTNQSYALYIPAKSGGKPLPVIYFFDPHSDGSLPLHKYKALADKYDFILVGSNNSKNGNDWTAAENIWLTLSGDVLKRLKINPDRLYVCGFSGGAKVAGYVALNHPGIKAVIANGAGLPDETPPGNFNFSLTFIAGEGDMNMTDVAAFNNEMDKTQARHRIIFFDGIHEWAPENTMDIAFAGLQLDAMFEKIIPQSDSFISDYIKQSKKRLDKHLAANNLVKAEEECKLSISMLNGLTAEINWFKEKDSLLIHNTAWQKQRQAQQKLFITEQNLKAGYQQQFSQGDKTYWAKTIDELQARAKVQTAEGAMYKRLQAYLSLAFYSLTNRLIAANQNAEAQNFVELYKMADAANSEAWYLSAVINARNNNSKAAEDDLLKAVALGFTDKERIIQQPDFKKLSVPLNFSKIESKMKKSE